MFFPFHDDNPTTRPPVVTVALVAVNVLCFLWILALPEARRQALYLEHGFIPARIQQLTNPQPLVIKQQVLVQHPFFGRIAQERAVAQLPADRGQIVTSLFTSMFLHGSWLHLIFNMWYLWLFGNNVEDRLGGVIFLLFYLGGGLLAAACHWAVDPGSTVPVVGASGAVAADPRRVCGYLALGTNPLFHPADYHLLGRRRAGLHRFGSLVPLTGHLGLAGDAWRHERGSRPVGAYRGIRSGSGIDADCGQADRCAAGEAAEEDY